MRNKHFAQIIGISIILFSCNSKPQIKDAYSEKFIQLSTKLVIEEHIDNDSSNTLMEKYVKLTTEIQKDSMIKELENALNQPLKSKISEEEYVKRYEEEWNSIKLQYNHGFPQYENYMNQLKGVDRDIEKTIQKYYSYEKEKSKLYKFREKLENSGRINNAIKDYEKYGQPMTEFDIKSTCQVYLKQNLKDPSSYELTSYKLDGQTKFGYAVSIEYRAKNSFGALVIDRNQFDVRFNSDKKEYYVHKMLN